MEGARTAVQFLGSTTLNATADITEVEQTLRAMPGVQVVTPSAQLEKGRPLFHPDRAISTVGALRTTTGCALADATGNASLSGMQGGRTTVMMTLTGDNLEAATSGLMLKP